MHSHRNASFSYPSPLLTSRGLCLSSSNCCLLVSVVEVTELKSLANHVVVGSVSCEMLDLFCPLPQTLAVDINDLGTVKLNLEVTWRYLNLQPFCFCNLTISTFLFSRLLLCFSLFFPVFLPFSVLLIRMTRHHPPVQSPNGCCPIRALLIRPLCGSRCFM